MAEFYFPATLTNESGRQTVTAFNENAESPIYTANSSHPMWDEIIEGLRTGDPDVWELFDVGSGVAKKFNQITDRVAFDGHNILFDGDVVHSTLTEHLMRVMERGNADDYLAVAKFWEKLESNPNAHSREQAYEWLASHRFQITPDGDVVGYKGVSEVDGRYLSCWSSRVADKPSAYVNGTPVASMSQVPQAIGDVVTMPRGEVKHDPSVPCARGLHVATRSYAQGYGTVLEVHVNPRDIVSVPSDASGEKVRCCRYKVARLATRADNNSPVLSSGDNIWAGDVGYRA